MELQEKHAIQLWAHRAITDLYKYFLMLIEDEIDREEINPEIYNFLRKRVLDAGNDKIRFFNEQVDNLIGMQRLKAENLKKELQKN